MVATQSLSLQWKESMKISRNRYYTLFEVQLDINFRWCSIRKIFFSPSPPTPQPSQPRAAAKLPEKEPTSLTHDSPGRRTTLHLSSLSNSLSPTISRKPVPQGNIAPESRSSKHNFKTLSNTILLPYHGLAQF